MSQELEDLLKEQEQLRAMRNSCLEYEKGLNEKIAKYCEEQLGLKSGDNFSILDIISRVLKG